jgi:hypothetical protein
VIESNAISWNVSSGPTVQTLTMTALAVSAYPIEPSDEHHFFARTISGATSAGGCTNSEAVVADQRR